MTQKTIATESLEERNRRMKWWREARFGMFIHWSAGASLNGYWKGEPSNWCSEWVRHSARIPRADYHEICRAFNPRWFHAEEWVALARQTGMKYMIFTAKHHDGFSFWNTAETDFNIMNSGCKRDVMRELADACRDQRMPLGWYYSPRDWDHPDYLPHYSRLSQKGAHYGGHWGYRPDPALGIEAEMDCGCSACIADRPIVEDRDPKRADLTRYLGFMRRQLRELVTQYGPAAALWFDGQEHNPTVGGTAELIRMLRELDPNLIINDRVATEPGWGDFGVHEHQIPGEQQARDWESCLTINGSWAFNAYDLSWKPASKLVRELCDIVSRGGNLLLNIGPDQDGGVPAECVRRLQELGRWLQVNGEAIYGTEAGAFASSDSLCFTRKGDTHYAIALKWPGETLLLPGVTPETACEITLLGSGLRLRWEAVPEGCRIHIPWMLQTAQPCDHACVFRILGCCTVKA